MPSMLDLRNVFQLVVDRLDDGALSRHDFVEHRHQLILHGCFQLGDELHIIGEERLEQLL